jgi:hypothetical protein
MSKKTRLYIDIDDTILAHALPGAGFDLRPGVMTQLALLGKMFNCCWLTTWPYSEPRHPKSREAQMSSVALMRCLYGTEINASFSYAEWNRNHPQRKAGFVLREGAPEDWYWLEDPLSDVEREALIAAGKMDRYIAVEPNGPWGFLDAVHDLLRRTGKSSTEIKRVGGRPEWFDRTTISVS